MSSAPDGETTAATPFPEAVKTSLARLNAAVDLAVEKRALYISGALQMIGIDKAYVDHAAGTYAVPAPRADPPAAGVSTPAPGDCIGEAPDR